MLEWFIIFTETESCNKPQCRIGIHKVEEPTSLIDSAVSSESPASHTHTIPPARPRSPITSIAVSGSISLAQSTLPSAVRYLLRVIVIYAIYT